jgi:EAL domain-containing protein (putative c-di-GMP-specific phosphodiesterase class I)
MGVRLAVTNFGAGCSQLSNLRQFPVATIKIEAVPLFERAMTSLFANRSRQARAATTE